MAAKMLVATQNININKQNQLKITKETLISNFLQQLCASTGTQVYFSMLYENIRFKNVVDEIILPNSVCLARK